MNVAMRLTNYISVPYGIVGTNKPKKISAGLGFTATKVIVKLTPIMRINNPKNA